ncbi:AAA family ATPase [Bradyrhizobium lablabi]|uniref:AAA domain-containing protein n=3 Tax=Bradyrhizobium lablabi TaxID=722472 RepID=A0A1H5JJL2_9BRAD|nr:AAA family ATPase [Bradyrhizobium lablabi]SEE52634.1 AAA domain-containing protein [Bradyrhizobium lablabi]
MTFHFAPAVRESVTLLIALAGASGSGKTFSALRLAKGMAPTGKIAFIDTEARRGLHYAEEFDFLHSDMRPPFRPAAFIEGIRAAEAAGAEVVIIDSFSHEYDGQGGIMDWADELEADGTKSPGNWKVPKGAHKKLMNALLQCRASIIFCLRADEKIRIARENGKTVVEPLGWMPICEKRFMFEMTASFTLTPDRPGIPHFDLPHKLQRQHRDMFTDKKPIGEDSGAALAEWARGGAPAPTTAQFKPTEQMEETSDDLMAWDSKLATAALQGVECLRETWATVPRDLKPKLKAAMDNRHKPAAESVPA